MNWARARCRRAIWPLHHHETGAGELDAVLKSTPWPPFTQIDVIAYREIELTRVPQRRTPTLSFVIACSPGWSARQVGDGVGDPLELGQQGLQLDLCWSRVVADLGSPGLEGATSSPRRAASPMDLERALRSACSSWVGDPDPAFLFQNIDRRYVQNVATCQPDERQLR